MFNRMCKDLTFYDDKKIEGLNITLEQIIFKGKIDTEDIKRIVYYAAINYKELIEYKTIPELLTFLYKKSLERRIPEQEIKLPKWLEKLMKV